MSARRQVIGYAALLLSVLAAGLWLAPRALAFYHLQTGGQMLEKALGPADPLEWWYIGPREAHSAQALEQAIAHLSQATSISYSWLLASRALAAQGDLLAGVRALERFTAWRPDNRLGHLELAAAYVLADQRLREMQYADLIAALPGSMISAPDVEGETSYQPEGWKSRYAYLTTFSLPPNYGDRPTLFLHAGSQVTYTLPLTQPAMLRFGMGLDPRSLSWGGDGATFEVFVEGKRIFLEYLPVDVAQKGWQEREVDLQQYAGRTLSLSLAVTPGPKGDITGDWAGWGEPRIEALQAEAYREEVRGRPWLVEWKKAGVTVGQLIDAGEQARQAEQYDQALSWYKWAMSLDPGLATSWRQAGLVYEDLQDWDNAVSALRQASHLAPHNRGVWYELGKVYAARKEWESALEAYQRGIAAGSGQVGRSILYYQIGLIRQYYLSPSDLDGAWEAYAQALEVNEYSTDTWTKADTYHQKAAILMSQGRWEDAAQEDLQALTTEPTHYWAHLSLASVLWRLGRREQAKELARQASELDPGAEQAHRLLGDFYSEEGNVIQACAAYRQALELNPQDEWVQRRLEPLSGYCPPR